MTNLLLGVAGGIVKLGLVAGGVGLLVAYKTKPTKDSFLIYVNKEIKKRTNSNLPIMPVLKLLNHTTDNITYNDYVFWATVEVDTNGVTEKPLNFVGAINHWMPRESAIKILNEIRN